MILYVSKWFLYNSSKWEKILGLEIKTDLKFNEYTENLRRRFKQKLHALARRLRHVNLCKNCFSEIFYNLQV